MPVSDLQQLVAYWREEPWGPWRDNVHAGLIAAAVANHSTKRLRRPMRWKDYLLRTHAASQTENRGSLLSVFRMMAGPKPGKGKKP